MKKVDKPGKLWKTTTAIPQVVIGWRWLLEVAPRTIFLRILSCDLFIVFPNYSLAWDTLPSPIEIKMLQLFSSVHSWLNWICALGHPKFFLESRLKLHGGVWPNPRPRVRSFKVAILRLFRLKLPTSELRRRGQTTSEMAENWCPVTFWPKLHRGVWGVIPKKIWGGLLYKPQS